MAVSLRDLFTPKTRDEVMASILNVASQVELPISAWQPLEPARELLEIIAVTTSQYTAAGFQAASSKLLSFAKGAWLTLTASEDYETDRDLGSYGTGTELLTNTTSISYTIDEGAYHFLNQYTGKTYTNVDAATLPPWSGVGAYPTVEITIIADELGSASNAAIGDINQFVTPLTGVLCTNTTTFVGNDEESDSNLVARARSGNARLSPNGPPDAYNYFAKNAKRADGTNVGVTRSRNYKPFSNRGNISVYIASATGAIPGANDDFTTDVGRVQLNLLENVVPTGLIVSTVSAEPVGILIQAIIYLKAGSTADPVQIRSGVLEQLAAYFATVQIGGIELVSGAGGYVFLSAIIDQFYNSAPDDIANVQILNTSTDFTLQLHQVPVLASTAADISITYAAS